MTENNMENNGMHVSFFRRLFAMLYDLLLLIALLIAATAIITIPLELKPTSEFFFLYQAYILIISYIYYAWFWIRKHQTPGMKTWKFKLKAVNHSQINWKTALIRFCVAIISLMSLGLGFIWVIYDKQNRTWHDIASNTRLVKT